MPSPILLVGNPTAQSGKNQERIDQALALFADGGVKPDFFSTLPGGKTIDAVRQHLDAHTYEVVVAMGGDGTFREVGAGILASTKATSIAYRPPSRPRSAPAWQRCLPHSRRS